MRQSPSGSVRLSVRASVRGPVSPEGMARPAASEAKRMTTTAPASERTAEELRQQTLDWLRENLPEGWIEAVDDGDHERMAELRKQLEYGEWCVRLGEAGYAT